MSITYKEARQRAADYIGEGREAAGGFTPVIIDEQVREVSVGWVFFYDAKEYLESGDFSCRLAGNAPLVVSRKDGHVYVTGTAAPVDEYLEAIAEEEERRLRG